LGDTAEPPEGVPEPPSEHVALIDGRDYERLQRRNLEPEQADPQSAVRYGIKHNPPARNKLSIVYPATCKGCMNFSLGSEGQAVPALGLPAVTLSVDAARLVASTDAVARPQVG